MLDRLLRASPPSEPDTHVASAQRLAFATRTAIKAITDERLFESHELSDAVIRLQQLAFLSDASMEHRLPTARMLTALAPEAAMGCADSLAGEIRRRRGSTTDAPVHQLNSTQRTALWEIACGNVVATSSLGRQYVHYRDARVLIGTLRSLEANDLVERVPHSAPSAYAGGAAAGPSPSHLGWNHRPGLHHLPASRRHEPAGHNTAALPCQCADGRPKPLTHPPAPPRPRSR
ncbi:hypothetical protein AB0F84_23565 [Streptomyces fradiae]